jgi:hypothetical protein
MLRSTIVVILFTFLILGCEISRGTDIDNIILNGEKKQVNINHKKLDSLKVLLDDSFIYMNMELAGNTGGPTYYRHYFDSDEVVKIGNIYNLLVETRFSALVGNALFFHVGIVSGSTTGFDTVLYGINLDTNQLHVYSKDDEAAPITADYRLNGKLISLMRGNTNKDADIMRFWFKLFDEKSNTIEKKREWTYDRVNKKGSVILNFCISDGKIYALVQDGDGSGKLITSIKIYDNGINLLRTINIDQVHDYIMSSAGGEIVVFGDFIFMHNYSNDGLIGQIENDTVKPLFQAGELELATNQFKYDMPVFYIRGTNKGYLLDIYNKSLKEFSLEMPSGYYITYGLSTNDYFLFLLRAEGRNDLVYLYQYQ